MASWRSTLLAKYKVEAKDFVKMELEALADLMTEKDQYVIFTKTPKIEYDADLHDNTTVRGVKTVIGLNKAQVYNLDPEEIKRAKYAHLVKLTTKKLVTSKDEIDNATALKMARKIKHPFIKKMWFLIHQR